MCASTRSIGRLSSWPPAWLRPAGVRHGWWANEGEKSRNLGNVIDPYDLIERYGLDQLRYFLLREVPFGNDGDFSHRSMVQRMNGELANDYGNLVQRTLSMIARNCGGRLREPDRLYGDKQLLGEAGGLLEACGRRGRAHSMRREEIWRVVPLRRHGAARGLTLRKNDPERHWGRALRCPEPSGSCLATLPSCQRPAHLDQLAVDRSPRFRAFARQAPFGPAPRCRKPQGVFPRFTGEEAQC